MSSPADAGTPLLTGPRFLAEAGQRHADAVARAGAVDRDLSFGDRRLRLRFAGSELAEQLLPALAQREVPVSGTADATIGLWDERATATPPLPIPWRDADVGPRGLVRDPLGGRPLAVDQPGAGAMTVLDPSGRALLHRILDAAQLPWWERAAPLRPALHWALGGPGRHLVHAGAVGDEARGGALLAGRGGSGKTTVAMAALEGGFRYVADDYLLLDLDSAPIAWNLYGWAKVDESQRARFPDLGGAARYFTPREPDQEREPDQKMVLDITAERPAALIESLPVRAVIVPQVRGGQTRVRRIGGGEALLALAPSSFLQMPFDDGAVVRSLAAVARAVPCFALEVGDRPAELAAALDRVLEEATQERYSS